MPTWDKLIKDSKKEHLLNFNSFLIFLFFSILNIKTSIMYLCNSIVFLVKNEAKIRQRKITDKVFILLLQP